jgi:hypothetical protein
MKKVWLWHPESPGVRVWVYPCLLRRWGIIRSEFATLGEMVRSYETVPMA